MIGSDIRMRWTRRQWLAHASALAVTPALAGLAAAADARTLLVLGDSLSAEYGLARGSGWVSLLDKRLGAQAPGWKLVNASISGETTSGGRTRLPALLKQHRPDLVILELGGNDALRGLPIANTRDNLATMARSAREAGAKVVVVGMEVPPNYGRRYAEDFSASFAKVARETGAALVPFLLRGVADVPEAETLFQPDRIHPTAQAQPTMLDNVWPVLRPLLR